MFLAFRPGTTSLQLACVTQLEECIGKIRSWMALNMLTLTDDKTEIIIFGTKQQLVTVSTINIKIGTKLITPTDFIRNIGFFMDKFLKGEQHTNKMSSQLYLQLKKIHQMRRCLDFASAKTVVEAIIMSKQDYCNSLLGGAPEYQLNRLQHLQNMACGAVCNLWKYGHVSTSKKSLHWLNICERIIVQMQKQPRPGLSG